MMTMTRLSLLSGLTFALGCSGPSGPPGGADAAPFCEDLCSAYLPCADGPSAPSEVATPLFCGGAAPARAERCQSICADSVARLGESQSAFLDCATCALPFTEDQVCDASQANEVGGVACPSVCTSATASAVNAFEDDFQTKMLADDMSHCAPGTLVIAAADPSVAHDGGHAGPNDGWVCDTEADCETGTLIIGPTLQLAPGTYTFGAQGVVLQSTSMPAEGQLAVEVLFGDDAYHNFTEGDLAQGTVSSDLTIVEASEVRVEFQLYTASSATVGALFITRH